MFSLPLLLNTTVLLSVKFIADEIILDRTVETKIKFFKSYPLKIIFANNKNNK